MCIGGSDSMALKDYYLILGIPRSESPAGIRAAYRDLAKQHHPDVAGTADADRFRELAEAYEVLSDPDRRQHYNHDLQESERPRPPSVLRKPQAEPLVPQSPSIFDDRDQVSPSFEELFDRYVRNFTGLRIPKAEREQALNVEVVLSLDEALRGGTLPVSLPVFEACPICHGTGIDWFFPCLECRAQRIVERRKTVSVRVPPRITAGTVIELPLRGLGIHNFYLRLHLVVGEH
jgi:molecular chaperone DnaJ